MVDKKTYFFDHNHPHEPAKCLQTHYFAKFLFIRLTELQHIKNRTKEKISFTFQSF